MKYDDFLSPTPTSVAVCCMLVIAIGATLFGIRADAQRLAEAKAAPVVRLDETPPVHGTIVEVEQARLVLGLVVRLDGPVFGNRGVLFDVMSTDLSLKVNDRVMVEALLAKQGPESENPQPKRVYIAWRKEMDQK